PDLRDQEKVAELMGVIAENLPEATYPFCHGMLLYSAGRLEEAEKALAAASETPSFSKCRRKALFELIFLQEQLALQKDGGKRYREYMAKAATNLRKLAKLGPLPKEAPSWAAPRLVGFAIYSGTPDVALKLLGDWKQRTLKDIAELTGTATNFGQLAVASELLGDWHARFPNDLEALRAQARLELRLGA